MKLFSIRRFLLTVGIAAALFGATVLSPKEATSQIGYGSTAATLTGGPITIDDGTAGAPAYSFTNNTDQGLYNAGAGNVGISSGGALMFNIEDTNAAGGSATIGLIQATLGIMDGTPDFVTGLSISLTNADHTGASNLLTGLNIAAITGDAETNETAVRIGAGWDDAMLIPDGMSLNFGTDSDFTIRESSNQLIFADDGGTVGFDFQANANQLLRIIDATGTTPTYKFGGQHVNNGSVVDGLDIEFTLAAQDGSQTLTILFVDVSQGNHTGVGNILNAIEIDAITGDAQGMETALLVGDGYDVGIASVGAIFDRQDFNEPLRVIPSSLADSTIDLADGDVNYVVASEGIQFEYREEQTKTTSSMIFASGSIDISADNTIDNEGVEIYLGASQNTTTGYLVAQTDQLCFAVNATVALIAGTDQFTVGWRANVAYDAAANYLNYTDYAIIGINNVDGSIFAEMDSTTGAAQTDDTTTDWANAETKTLKVCISGDGETHHYLDGSLIAEANVVDAIDSSIIMNPFITYLQAGGAVDAAIRINWWEITAN